MYHFLLEMFKIFSAWVANTPPLLFFFLFAIYSSEWFSSLTVCYVCEVNTAFGGQFMCFVLWTFLSAIILFTFALPHLSSRDAPVLHEFLCEEPKLTNYSSLLLLISCSVMADSLWPLDCSPPDSMDSSNRPAIQKIRNSWFQVW